MMDIVDARELGEHISDAEVAIGEAFECIDNLPQEDQESNLIRGILTDLHEANGILSMSSDVRMNRIFTAIENNQ